MKIIYVLVTRSETGKVEASMRGYKLGLRGLKNFIRISCKFRTRILLEAEFFSFFKACLGKITINLYRLRVSGLRLADSQQVRRRVLRRVRWFNRSNRDNSTYLMKAGVLKMLCWNLAMYWQNLKKLNWVIMHVFILLGKFVDKINIHLLIQKDFIKRKLGSSLATDMKF